MREVGVQSRFRSGLRLVAINLVLLLSVAFIAELIFGAWFSATGFSPVRVERDARIVFDGSKLYAGGGIFEYRRDRHGLRGTYDDPGNVGILALGGSTTNELYVGEGETWTDVLAESFREGGAPISVVNAGIDGQSTIGHLRNFDLWFPGIPGLKARYVLAYIGINDIHAEAHTQYDDIAATDTGSRVARFVKDRSALYRAHRTLKGMLAARRSRLLHSDVDWSRVIRRETARPTEFAPESAEEAARLARFGERVEGLIGRIRSFGAEAIIVSQHRGTYRIAGERLIFAAEGPLPNGLGDYRVQTRFNRMAMEVCRAQRAICIDLGAEIEFQPGDFQDYVHTTPQGSRRVGEFLYTRLKDVIR